MKLKSIALILMTVALPAMAEKVSVNKKGISMLRMESLPSISISVLS